MEGHFNFHHFVLLVIKKIYIFCKLGLIECYKQISYLSIAENPMLIDKMTVQQCCVEDSTWFVMFLQYFATNYIQGAVNILIG